MKKRITKPVIKPVIGITPDYHSGDQNIDGSGEPTLFLRARYMQAVEAMGGVPLILPVTASKEIQEALLSKVQGLLMTGSGPDLDPALYGEEQQFRFKKMSRERADSEIALARMALEADLPVLGICGGAQLMNVVLGGSLYQDIASQIPGALDHRQKTAATGPAHGVAITPGTRLHAILKTDRLQVNSSHHQATKTVGPGLVVNAKAEDGVIEGLESPRHRFALGVQWHPEFMYARDEASRRILSAFLQEAAG
jgi:putative glutamine amidotransferase